MSVTSRRVASVPVRASVETWHEIVNLLAPDAGAARTALLAVAGPCAAIVSEEYTRDAPIVVSPASGPQIRVYTVHGEVAIDALNDELPLTVRPLAEPGWTLSLPCGVDDIDDIRRLLEHHSQITVRDLTTPTSSRTVADAPQGSLVVNLEELR